MYFKTYFSTSIKKQLFPDYVIYISEGQENITKISLSLENSVEDSVKEKTESLIMLDNKLTGNEFEEINYDLSKNNEQKM